MATVESDNAALKKSNAALKKSNAALKEATLATKAALDSFKAALDSFIAEFIVRATVESDNAALVAKVATVESDNAAVKADNSAIKESDAALNESTNSLHFVNAERDICQVIDDVYASILKEMRKSGRFQNIQTLSSLLSGKTSKNDQEKRLLDEEIVAALSSLAKLQLHSQKQRHTTGGHCPELNSDEISSSILIQSPGRKVWPSSSTQTAQFKEIIEILIPIVCSPNSSF
eukprot:gene35996-46764_t